MRWEKLSLNALRSRCAHKHCGTTRRPSTGRKVARLATWIKRRRAPQPQRPSRVPAHRSHPAPCRQIDDCENPNRLSACDKTQHIEAHSTKAYKSLYGSCPVKSAGLKSTPPNSTKSIRVLRVKMEVAVRDDELRLRVCSVKLCTLSSKSLMHSVVY